MNPLPLPVHMEGQPEWIILGEIGLGQSLSLDLPFNEQLAKLVYNLGLSPVRLNQIHAAIHNTVATEMSKDGNSEFCIRIFQMAVETPDKKTAQQVDTRQLPQVETGESCSSGVKAWGYFLIAAGTTQHPQEAAARQMIDLFLYPEGS